MKKKEEKKSEITKSKAPDEDMKPKKDEELHKGYNEKNPVQPEGSFTPDSKTGKNNV